MFGHVAGRQHPSRWVMLSFLFAFVLAWSYTSMGDQRGYSWGFLRFGLVVAVAISATRLGTMSMSILRRKRKGAEKQGEWADGDGSETDEERRPTYGEIFGTPEPHHDDDERDAMEADADEADAMPEHVEEIEADAETPVGSDEMTDAELEAISDDDAQAELDAIAGHDAQHELEAISDEDAQAELDAMMDHETSGDEDGGAEVDASDENVEEIEADLEAQESLRRMREAFKARAREAELRVKQRETEPDQAPSPQ